MSEVPSAEQDLVTQQDEASRTARFQRALEALSPRLRAPLEMRLRGEPYKEIAHLLQLNLNVVKTRLHEAKIELRRMIGNAPEEVDDDDDA
jgi:DNA-directed RNA polymerase specialized sigma24 family protein